jgi:excisionase family DNA binding protein
LHLLQIASSVSRMSGTVFFEDVSEEVREAAHRIAEHLVTTRGERSQVLDALEDQPDLRELVTALAERLVRDLAAGRHPIYTTIEDEVTPADAARLLGVSRQYVDRLIVDGRLPFTRKPGSTHRTIRVADVERLDAQRTRRRENTNKAITALVEGGLDY